MYPSNGSIDLSLIFPWIKTLQTSQKTISSHSTFPFHQRISPSANQYFSFIREHHHQPISISLSSENTAISQSAFLIFLSGSILFDGQSNNVCLSASLTSVTSFHGLSFEEDSLTTCLARSVSKAKFDKHMLFYTHHYSSDNQCTQ